MEFQDVIAQRHSIRVFKPERVGRQHLDALLASMIRAPSAGDLQSYQVIIIEDPAQRRRLSDAALAQDAVAIAPLVLVFLTSDAQARETFGDAGRLFAIQDATLAAAYAQLTATSLGLGSVWVGKMDVEGVRLVVNAPRGLVPVSMLCVGHPAEEPLSTPRKQLRNIVHRGTWGHPWA